MRRNFRVLLFFALGFLLIVSFQNCSQDETPVGGITDWNATPVPVATSTPAPTPTLSREGAQCDIQTYTGSTQCNSPSVTFTFDSLPKDGNGNPMAQTITVPSGCTIMKVKIWGAGGGATSDYKFGGNGAYVGGTIPVYPNEELKVIVGEGGKSSGKATFGGGGAAGVFGGASAGGSSGGGRSAIIRGGYDIATAGGGGGAGAGNPTGYWGIGGTCDSNQNRQAQATGTVSTGGALNVVAQGGAAAVTGTTAVAASAGDGGSAAIANGALEVGSGSAGSRFQGGQGGSGNPGSGGGGGGYFGGGGGASSGKQTPASNINFASAGGAGGSYVGCGNTTAKGPLSISQSGGNRPNQIIGFGQAPILGFSCDTPSRGGGGYQTHTDIDTCTNQFDGSHGFVYIEWSS